MRLKEEIIHQVKQHGTAAGFKKAKKDEVDIADITVAYDNVTIINLLKKRGSSLASGLMKEFEATEAEIKAHIRDDDSFS